MWLTLDRKIKEGILVYACAFFEWKSHLLHGPNLTQLKFFEEICVELSSEWLTYMPGRLITAVKKIKIMNPSEVPNGKRQ